MSEIRTCCRNCPFALYEGKTQTDCSLGRLDKYQRQNVSVVEAYDEEKEFFLIKERICPYCRTPDWAEKNKGKDLTEVAKAENALRLEVVVPVEAGEFDKAKETIRSVENQTRPVFRLNIAINQCEYTPATFITELRTKSFDWNVYAANEKLSRGMLVHRAVEHSKSNYFIATYAGTSLYANFVERLARAVEEEESRFIYLSHDLLQVYQTGSFKHMGGNMPIQVAGPDKVEYLNDFWEKLQFAMRTNGESELVGRLEDFI